MKKTLSAVLSICELCLLLAGCKPQNPAPSQIMLDPETVSIEENQLYDDYFYAAFQGTLIRYEPESGKEAVTCNDPLCQHEGESCLASLVKQDCVYIANDAVYYVRGKGVFCGDLYRYDKADGTSKQIYSHEGDISFLYPIGQFLYFVATTNQVSEENSEQIITTIDLYRYDHTQEQVSKLNTEPLHDHPSYSSHTDKRIFWSDTDSHSYYSTDINYQNRQEETPSEGLVRGNTLFTIEQTVDPQLKTLVVSLTGKSLSNGDSVTFPPCTSFRMLDDKMLYLPPAEKTVSLGKEETGNDFRIFHRNEIHVINLDGSDDHLLLRMEDKVT